MVDVAFLVLFAVNPEETAAFYRAVGIDSPASRPL